MRDKEAVHQDVMLRLYRLSCVSKLTSMTLLPKLSKNDDSKLLSIATDRDVSDHFFGATPWPFQDGFLVTT